MAQGDADRKHRLARSRLLQTVLLRELDLVVRTLRDMQAGFPSGADGGTGDWDDRTQAAANTADRARKDYARLDALIRDIDIKANELDSIRTQWTITTKDRPTGEAPAICVSCERIPNETTGVYASARCKWCYEHYLAEVEVDGQVVKPKNQDVPISILKVRLKLMRNVTTGDWRKVLAERGQAKRKAS